MMRRLLAMLQQEARMQYRNGFYGAVVFVAALWIGLLWFLPDFNWRPWLPFLVFSNLVITTYYFMAGLLLLDKNDGTLEALVVTPLHPGEFLAARVISLSLLATAENVLILGLGLGFDHLPLLALPAIIVTAALFSLFGYLSVIRYDSINEFMLPAVLFTVVLSLPVAPHFNWVDHGWSWLHPLGPAMNWLESSFWQQTWLSQTLAAAVCAVVVMAVFKLALNRHLRFVAMRAGDQR